MRTAVIDAHHSSSCKRSLSPHGRRIPTRPRSAIDRPDAACYQGVSSQVRMSTNLLERVAKRLTGIIGLLPELDLLQVHAGADRQLDQRAGQEIFVLADGED